MVPKLDLDFISPPSCHGIFSPLVSAGLLSVIMGMRYKKSGKLMPAGIMSGLRSEYSLLNKTGISLNHMFCLCRKVNPLHFDIYYKIIKHVMCLLLS